MQVILLEKIEKLGDFGDEVKVKPGYGRNFLIPQGKAAPATPENRERAEAQRAEREQSRQESLAAARSRAEKLDGLQLSLRRRVAAEDRLFGSVGAADIAAAVSETGTELARQEIRLPDGPLKELGEHQVRLHLHADVDVAISVTIIPEEE